MPIISLFSAITLLASTPAGIGQAGPDPDSKAALEEIKAQTLSQSPAYAYVQELSDTFGPRLTGSVQAAKACEWAEQKMKGIGLKNVHLEPWHLSHGWQRGRAFAQLTAPFRLDLNITSYGWVGSTKAGGVDADVALVNDDQLGEEIKRHAASWRGKVLLLAPLGPTHKNGIRTYSELGGLLTAAAKAHAVAVISAAGRPGVMLTHTGPALFYDSYVPIPVVDIAAEHQKMLVRLLTQKKTVRMKIDVENEVTAGSVMSPNVVGEIPGFEHPEEVVLLCAHIDSWDLATGAVDDGEGVAAVLGAANAILVEHVRPRRTIRFVLFTGEEEGLLGSLAYVRTHKAEMKNVVASFAIDWGAGPITKIPLAGREELEPAYRHFTQLVADLGDIQVDHTYLLFTDAYSFTLAGIPGVALLQNSPDYSTIGHSAADTLDKVDKKNLIQNTAFLACISFWSANYPNRLSKPWTPAATEAALIRDNQRTMLQLFSLWPFVAPRR